MQLSPQELSSLLTWLIASFGGWTVVVSGLVFYLGDRFTKRALQNEAAAISRTLADLGHELKLRESSYTRHVDLLLNYYSVYYRHYRRCQNATNQDALKQPDGLVQKTRDIFNDELDDFLREFKENEGRVRLVLPEHLLLIHEDSIAAFNAFKDAMKAERYDDKYHKEKYAAFEGVLQAKERMEAGLREFLRTEHLLRSVK